MFVASGESFLQIMQHFDFPDMRVLNVRLVWQTYILEHERQVSYFLIYISVITFYKPL